jgi:hypothetical protein
MQITFKDKARADEKAEQLGVRCIFEIASGLQIGDID